MNDARVKELGRLGAAIPSRVGMQTLLFAAPVLAAVCSFAVYGAVQPANFTAARIFSSIALFGIMRIPLVLLPFALVEVRFPVRSPALPPPHGPATWIMCILLVLLPFALVEVPSPPPPHQTSLLFDGEGGWTYSDPW